MFHHMVLIRFKSPLSQEDHQYILGVSEDMKREISGIEFLDFVENTADRSQGHTHAFVSAFVNEAAHEAYQIHPLHIPLKDRIKEIADSVIALDFEG